VDLKEEKEKYAMAARDEDEEETYRRDMFQKRLGLSNLGNSCYINCIV